MLCGSSVPVLLCVNEVSMRLGVFTLELNINNEWSNARGQSTLTPWCRVSNIPDAGSSCGRAVSILVLGSRNELTVFDGSLFCDYLTTQKKAIHPKALAMDTTRNCTASRVGQANRLRCSISSA